jgi:hypothetical protein
MGTWCPACGGTQKRTIEEMKQMALKRGGKCLSKEYANIETKLLWECAEGHRWEAQPNGIRSGSWCPQCSSALAERICREYFEQLFGKRFPKVKPSWLRLANKSRLELDGYCEKLGLAFEHQGPHHYGLDIYSPITNERAIRQKERDRLKRLLCRKNGVILISVPEIPTRLPQNEIKDFIRSECEKRKIKLPKDFDSKKVNLRDAYAVPETKRQLDRLLAIAKERGGRCLSRAYKGHYVKLLWQCRHLHRWKAQPADIKGGQARASGLQAELGQLLDDNDPRWLAFGFDLPGHPSAPDVPQNLVVIPGAAGSGSLFVHNDDARGAAGYRFTVTNAADGSELAEQLTQDAEAAFDSLPTGANVNVVVTARNATGESQPSASVAAVVP